MKRRYWASFVVVLGLGVTVAEASPWQEIWRDLDILATPLGGPLSTTADGTRVNGARSGRLRIVPNGIGGGYQLELDRTFGVDSRGRPEELRINGLADITLDGATELTLGYNGKGAFRLYHGDFAANNLSYSARTTNGAQDVQLVGTLNVANSFEVNPLGFYTVSVNIRNTNSQLFLDGVLAQDQQATNFDIGPIVIRGNAYYDATLALLTAAGVDTTDLEKVFPRSPAPQIDQAIQDALQDAGLTGTAEARLAPLVAKAVTDQTTSDLVAGLLSDSALTGEGSSGASTLVAPEPGTLALFGTGAMVLLWYWRRRA
jgi:hypothetical protein